MLRVDTQNGHIYIKGVTFWFSKAIIFAIYVYLCYFSGLHVFFFETWYTLLGRVRLSTCFYEVLFVVPGFCLNGNSEQALGEGGTPANPEAKQGVSSGATSTPRFPYSGLMHLNISLSTSLLGSPSAILGHFFRIFFKFLGKKTC